MFGWSPATACDHRVPRPRQAVDDERIDRRPPGRCSMRSARLRRFLDKARRAEDVPCVVLFVDADRALGERLCVGPTLLREADSGQLGDRRRSLRTLTMTSPRISSAAGRPARPISSTASSSSLPHYCLRRRRRLRGHRPFLRVGARARRAAPGIWPPPSAGRGPRGRSRNGPHVGSWTMIDFSSAPTATT